MKKRLVILVIVTLIFSVINIYAALKFSNSFLIYKASTILFIIILIQNILIKKERLNKLVTNLLVLILYIILNGIVFRIFNYSDTFLFPHNIKGVETIKTNRESYDWQTSKSNNYISDTLKLQSIIDKHSKFWFSRSLLIVKGDELIVEEYFNGKNKNDAFNIMSCTKSFISALVGIAIERGEIKDINEKISNIFPEYFKNNDHIDKSNITIKQLLTMQAGYPFGFSGDNGINWLNCILSEQLSYQPGDQFCYSAATSHVLSEILTKSTNRNAEEYANEVLFKPLGINAAYWIKSPNGVNAGNWGMFMTPRDMARFGYLYMKNGIIDNKTILSKSWIDLSFQDYSINKERCDKIPFDNYGFQWWFKNISSFKAISAVGFGGQLIMLIPEKSLIVVVTNSRYESAEKGDLNTMQTLSTIEEIIKLVK